MPYPNGDPTLGEQLDQHAKNKAIGKELSACWDEGYAEGIKAINADLLAMLKLATHELNAIRARDGAPQHIDWYRGRPMQNSSCTDEWWDELTEKCFAAIAKAEQ